MIQKLWFWCHKILPLIYDDSLSYYEFLCKMNAKLSEVIDEINSHGEAITALEETVNSALTELDEKLEDGLADLMSALTAWEESHATAVQMEQTLGDDTTKVVSQKAITDAVMALHDHSLLMRGEVSNEAVAGGDITFDLNDTNFFNSVWYCGTDFTTNPNAQHLPQLTQGVVTTKCPVLLDELGSTAKVHCVEQTYVTDNQTDPCMWIRYADWTGSGWSWGTWTLIAV